MSFKEIFNFTYAGLMSQIALVIFLGVFIVLAIRAFRHSANEMNAASNLPLEDDAGKERQS